MSLTHIGCTGLADIQAVLHIEIASRIVYNSSTANHHGRHVTSQKETFRRQLVKASRSMQVWMSKRRRTERSGFVITEHGAMFALDFITTTTMRQIIKTRLHKIMTAVIKQKTREEAAA